MRSWGRTPFSTPVVEKCRKNPGESHGKCWKYLLEITAFCWEISWKKELRENLQDGAFSRCSVQVLVEHHGFLWSKNHHETMALNHFELEPRSLCEVAVVESPDGHWGYDGMMVDHR